MSRIYHATLESIRATFLNRTTVSATELSAVLADPVSRRMLHRELQQTPGTLAISNLCVEEDVLQNLKAQIQHLAQQTDLDPSAVAQTLLSRNIVHVLNLEQEVLRAFLLQQRQTQSSLADSSSKLGSFFELPDFLQSYSPYINGCIVLFMSLFFLVACSVIGVSVIEGVFGVELTSPAHTYLAVVALFVGGNALDPLVSYGQKRIKAGLESDISQEWTDVLNMKTNADAVLLGMIEAGLGRLTPENTSAAPNFAAKTPTHALHFMLHLGSNHSGRKG